MAILDKGAKKALRVDLAPETFKVFKRWGLDHDLTLPEVLEAAAQALIEKGVAPKKNKKVAPEPIQESLEVGAHRIPLPIGTPTTPPAEVEPDWDELMKSAE